MNLEKIVKKFLENPKRMRMGRGKLANRWNCSKETIVKARQIARARLSSEEYKNFPKILIFDIETSPMRAFVWRRWKQNVGLPQTISEWHMLTWSAKWLGSNEIYSDRIYSDEVFEEDDSRITKSLWELIDQADFVVAHNAVAFDVKKMNSRFIINGLQPPSPYKVIDTKVIAAKTFGFSSNKLDALAGYFNIEHKLDTDFELWDRCMRGDDEALAYMETYNKKDVEILEEVYLRLRMWDKGRQNIGVYMNSSVPICSCCGSTHVKELQDKYYFTSAGKYQVYKCECGATSRGQKNLLTKEDRKILLRPNPR